MWEGWWVDLDDVLLMTSGLNYVGMTVHMCGNCSCANLSVCVYMHVCIMSMVSVCAVSHACRTSVGAFFKSGNSRKNFLGATLLL